ncbi:MAG: ATP-binding protein [Chloroflexi bacterium]|nr:ATP-binding protein [Chloroflexota bacterium]
MAEPERTGDILRRMQIPGLPSGDPTHTSSNTSAEAAEPPACPVCGGAGFVYPNVPLDDPRYGTAVPCRCQQRGLQDQRLARLQRYSNLGPLLRLTFATLIPHGHSTHPERQARYRRAVESARSWAAQPQGWLVLLGPSGCGKTHLAAAVANACLEAGQPCFFMSVPDLLDHLRSTFAPQSTVSYDDLFEQVRTAPILVLDDLGAQSSTPWAQEKLFQVLNFRYSAQLPTVVTSSAALEHLEERIRTRLEDPAVSQVWVLEEPQGALHQYQEILDLAHLRHMTFETFQRSHEGLDQQHQHNLAEAYELAAFFAENPSGWLVIQGVHGCGKTHLAAAIGHARRQAGQPVLFLVVADLLDHLRSTFAPESPVTYDDLFEQVRTAPLLILDDLGAHASSPWALEKLYQILNYRYNARLATVITTSIPLEEMDGRLRFRLLDGQVSQVFLITADSYIVNRLRREEPPRPRGGTGRRQRP